MFRSIHLVKSAQPECTGICRIIMGLAKYAEPNGYECRVLFFADGPLKAQMSAAGISAHAIPWNGTFQDVVGAVRVCLWLRRKGADLAHLHWGGRAVRAICRLGGAPAVVQHVHGRINEITGEIPGSISFPWADAVIASSNAVAACVKSHRAEVIYAGIEVNPAPESLTEHSGPLQVGVLSRLTPIKNIGAVIKAAARLREKGIEIQVNIAGSGPSEPELRHIAAELRVTDRVCFLGWQQDIRKLLSNWDLLLMPSLDESFPISALEAMAAARPVLASRVGGLPEIVVGGVTGELIPPEETAALVDHIATLANDRARLAEMGQAGWRRAQAEFSLQATATHMFRFYDRLLKDRLARSGDAEFI
ncbi:MAG: glycosyltransferase family 4 protein [Terracidiphilus sp.]